MARLLLIAVSMNPEEIEPGSQHIVEIPEPTPRVLIVRRRSYPVVIVAACLGLTGILIGVFMVARQRSSDEHLTTDALQREELRDGWKTLGAAAALEAQTGSAPVAQPAPPANVLIVNVPSPAGPQGPQGAPGQPGQTVVVGSPSNAANASGSTVSGSLPGALPVTNYTLPVAPYGVGTQQNPVNPPAGNGSNPGGTSNPALPGNGGAYPSPGSSNSSTNGSANVVNPTSNIPSGTSNLPTGSSTLPSGVP